ncbi:MAG: hypothetical protein LZ174_09010 [Thaumarchaeota archaeon]|jgi:hypothetical protein|nr:hypothetical protein [Candidatus Geocrenenecus arthurdayi]
MGFEVWLEGDFNFGKLHELLQDMDDIADVTEMDRGRFTMHLRGVKDITFQFYSRGKIHITLDYYARPFHIVWIIRSLCFLASGRDPSLKLVRFWPLPEDFKDFGVRDRLRDFGRRLEPSWIDYLPDIQNMMLEDLLEGLRSDEHEAKHEFEGEDKPLWWRFLKMGGEGEA